MIRAVLFDLDGTLLPMDQEEFIQAYMGEIAGRFGSEELKKEDLIRALWKGTGAMVKNDGTSSNEEVFWKVFAGLLGEGILRRRSEFDDFYTREFKNVGRIASPNDLAGRCVERLKEKGYRLIAATNPLFPRTATLERMSWAGIDPASFELITTYENSAYCKPNLEYYRNILDRQGLLAEECLMVGNDVAEDMCTSKLGMDTFLLTEHLIPAEGVDTKEMRQGGFKELYNYIEDMPILKEGVL
ncbi:HAD family hydrolase [Murimonas intestini]|uniref:HAD family hydrolase n=1 Tax=Murimonas intestini TaxID=1337051 RepID=UPI0011DE2F0D|nr:HAD family hydrolase [Murimonas intestini]